MKLAAVVILYYPDENVINNILSYISMVDCLIIWNNTPYDQREQYTIEIPTYSDKIVYLGTDKNEGIAYALNQTINWCIDNEYSHLLTMDQDSCFENFKYYIEYIRMNLLGSSNIFIPNKYFIDKTSYQYNTEKEIITVPYFMNSGTVFKLSIFKCLGGFREDYFIDAVDHEFSLRARDKGYQVFCITKAILKHQIGYNTKTWLGFYTSNYSAFRTYYVIRNHVWLKREYPSYSVPKFFYVHIVKRFFGIIISEKDKCSKLLALFNGIKDGFWRKNKSNKKK